MSSAPPVSRVALGPTFREQVLGSALRVSDLLAVGLAFAVAVSLVPDAERVAAGDVLRTVALLLATSGAFAASGLYARPPRPLRELAGLAAASALVTAGLAGLDALLGAGVAWENLSGLWAGATLLAFAGRQILRALARHWAASPHARRRVLVLGSGARALRYARGVEGHPELGMEIIGFADEGWPGLEAFRGTGHNLVSDFKNFAAFLRQNVIDEVAVAMPLSVLHRSRFDPIADALEQGVTLRFVACAVDDLDLAHTHTGTLASRVAITRFAGRVDGWAAATKRGIDLVASAGLLLALAPLFVVVALAVRISSRGPAFFVQERVGLNGRTFRMFKFRTMVDGAEALQLELEARNEADGPVFKIEDDPRITPFGRFLRRASLDELPQLLNVLRGEMSLVGPRPLPWRDVDGFQEDAHRRRFSVKPGLTGLWQVSGRSTLPFEQWVEHDLRYVDDWSLRMDLEILIKTIPAVLRAEGAV